MLLTNSKGGAPEPTPLQLQLRKRKRDDSVEDEDSDVNVQLCTRLCPSHSISMLEIVAQKPQNRIVLQANQLKEGTLVHGTAVRCKVCPKPAPNANFCCVQCSNEMDGCIFGVCGPKSGRICSQVNQKRMWSTYICI